MQRKRGPLTELTPPPESPTFTPKSASTAEASIPIAVGLFFVTLVGLSVRADGWLPAPASSQVSRASFSEERARVHLREITALGVRNVGSRANEEFALPTVSF